MVINDIKKGPLIMTNENRKISLLILIGSILIEIIFLYFLYFFIIKPLYKENLWFDIPLFLPVVISLFFTIMGLIEYIRGGIKYYENGIYIPTGIMKKEFIKYFEIEYIMIPEQTTRQFLWYGDLTPKIKIKYQDKFIRIRKISKNAVEILESKCQLIRFRGKYELETDASRSEQVGVYR